jgi:plastocyanin
MPMRFRTLTTLAALALTVAACSAEKQGDGAGTAATGTTTPAADGALTPDAGGKMISVEMETDATGNNIFEPATFEARKGDVIRYILVSGVHNAHFLADSNPGKQGLPPAGPLLQLPGQTYDVKVSFEAGNYYFQCDPHALLGMKGRVTVVQ